MPPLFGCFQKTYSLKMEKIQYQALKIVFNSNESFEDLIFHMNKVPIHQKQLRQVTSEIYISLTDLSPEIIKLFFTVKKMPYNLRNEHVLNLPSARTTYHGTNSVLFRTCQVWNNLLLFIQQIQSLLQFKTHKKTLTDIECLCKICQRL